MQEVGTRISGAMAPFDYQPRTRLVFGVGTIERTGEIVRELGARKVLLVTDAGIVAAGHAEHLLKSLAVDGVDAVLFDKVRENPTTRDVDACVAAARDAKVEAFIGLGGGSSMDQRLQLSPDQRRADEGLLGRWQSDETHAAVDRDPHDGGHRKRVPERRAHCGRAVAPEDGVP
jgi:hypothetical protein